jgi:hypothetical protein
MIDEAKDSKKDPIPETPAAPKVAMKFNPRGEDGKNKIEKMTLAQPRRRLEAPITPLTVGSPTPDGSPPVITPPPAESKSSSRSFLFPIIAALIVAFLGGAGWYFYDLSNRTSLNVQINPGDLEVTPQAILIYDFSERIKFIKKDYIRRKQPIEDRLDNAKFELERNQTELTRRLEEKAILDKHLQKDREALNAIITENEKKLDSIWSVEAKQINQRYEQKRLGTIKQVEERAKSLGLQYSPDKTLSDSVQAALNAYRLALYQANDQVNVLKERQWINSLLDQWVNEDADWQKEMAAVRVKAEENRKQLGSEIEESKNSIADIEPKVKKTDEDVKELQDLVNIAQTRIEEERKNSLEVFAPFYEEITRMPNNESYIRSEFKIINNSISVKDLQHQKDLPAGKYLLLVRAFQGDEEYWATKEFTLKEKTENKISIEANDFVPVRNFLER